MCRFSVVLRTSLLLLALAMPATPLQAQLRGEVAPGDRVRVEVPVFGRLTGTVVAFDSAFLLMRPAGAEADYSLPVAELVRIDVARGRSWGKGVLRGAGIGLLAGGALGTGLGVRAARSDPDTFMDDVAVAAGAVFFGGAGTILGAGIGALTPVTRWVRLAGR